MFEAVGLDPPEGRAYRVLLRMPTASAEELAEQLELPAAEVVTHLHAMERKGLVSRAPNRNGRFRATPPELAFGPVLRHRQQELESIQDTIGRLTEEWRSRATRHDAAELVEVVYGREAIAQRFAQLQLSARREVLGLMREPSFAVTAKENIAEQTALTGGVEYRVVYDAALLELPGDPYQISQSIRGGEQARVAAEVPVKMVLVDRSLAVVPLESTRSDGEPSAILVHASGLLDVLVAFFEMIWAAATPLYATPDGAVPPERPGSEPSEQDRQLLSLLLAGLTDQAIALQLGTSMRTVQRRVRDLIELAGVRTRLQLAWQAAYRGWI
jgi:predicted transcriptional regulator/DNA-binding CsgD family transcriptional regulator